MVFFYRIRHGASLADREREWLLAVDVLACFARRDDLNGMPMIGCNNLHGVNVPPREQVAKIFVGIATLVRSGGSFVGVVLFKQFPAGLASANGAVPVAGAFAIHVANSNDLHAFVRNHGPNVVEPLVSSANHTNNDAAVGTWPSLVDKRCSGEIGWERQVRSCSCGSP